MPISLKQLLRPLRPSSASSDSTGKMSSNSTPSSTVNSDLMAPVEPTSESEDSSLTVVELFQSQGCNSCPPANANVIDLIETPNTHNLLALTYEVTYWDHLGWKDTFGNSKFDERQRDYAKGLGLRGVYTPQVCTQELFYLRYLTTYPVLITGDC